jgi:serine/threonine protein kinase
MIKGNKIRDGAYGMVYSGTIPTVEGKRDEIAIKRNLVSREISFAGSIRELDLLNRLRGHPFLIGIRCVTIGDPFSGRVMSPINISGQRDDIFHFVFEMAEDDIHNYIYMNNKYPPYNIIKKFMVELLLGMEFLHSQKIMHRDIKPGNLLVVNGILKICDFGMSKPYTKQDKSTPQIVTSWYRPPEVTLSDPNYDYKADMWSVGLVLFEMIGRNAFMCNTADHPDIVINRILGSLPEEVDSKLMNMVINNPYRSMEINPTASPTNRYSFEKQLNLSQQNIQRFNNECLENGHGGYVDFIDLISKLIVFDPRERLSATQALEHPFFNNMTLFIEEIRRDYPPVFSPSIDRPLVVHKCKEREWSVQIALTLYNNRNNYTWYTHRILFQSLSLFDRYIDYLFDSNNMANITRREESEYSGCYHTQSEVYLRYIVCLYVSIKYFTTLKSPQSFLSLIISEFRTEESLLIAEQFEITLLKDVLKYSIYSNTLLEIADNSNEKLNENQIRDLLLIYCNTEVYSGMTPKELYQLYRITILIDDANKTSQEITDDDLFERVW